MTKIVWVLLVVRFSAELLCIYIIHCRSGYLSSKRNIKAIFYDNIIHRNTHVCIRIHELEWEHISSQILKLKNANSIPKASFPNKRSFNNIIHGKIVCLRRKDPNRSMFESNIYRIQALATIDLSRLQSIVVQRVNSSTFLLHFLRVPIFDTHVFV